MSLRVKPKLIGDAHGQDPQGTKVVAVTTVRGGSWKTLCAGKHAKGSTWYRISIVNGKSVSKRYGVKYVYAATSLFKAVITTTTLTTACDGARLRTGTSTTSTTKAKLSAGTRVTSVGTVGRWELERRLQRAHRLEQQVVPDHRRER